MKGKQQADQLLSLLAPDGLAVSLITVGEIYEGIYYGANPSVHEAGFRRFLRGVDVLSLNRSIVKHFARIRGDLRRKGQIIGDPDILIMATAMFPNLSLVTRNSKISGASQVS